jgi:hypothetical protein
MADITGGSASYLFYGLNYEEALNKREEILAQIHEENLPLIAERVRKRSITEGDTPRVGDFYQKPSGEWDRFTHEWNDGIQVGGMRGSFFFGSSGGCSYSGGLDSSIPYERFEKTDDVRDGGAWFFDRDRAGAHNGFHFKAPFRVWRLNSAD